MIFQRFSRLFPCFITLSLVFILCLPLTAAADEGASIILTFTGDCTLGGEDRLINKEYSFISFVNKHGFAYPFEKVKTLFEQDDLTIINLENVFYDNTDNRADKNYLFRAPTNFAQILSEGSVELAFIANNHILDYGKAGMQNTIRSLEALNVNVFGSNHELSSTYIFEKNGVRIGFLGSYQAFWYSAREQFSRSLDELKEAGCDVIIGIIHDGTEYAPNRNRRQQQMAEWYVNQGVSLVIGHHPHVPQGVDLIGNATVLYSLGNFSFGGNKDLDIARRPGKRADRALIARVELRFDKDANYLGHQVNLIPVSPSGSTDYNNYQPVLLTGEEALETLALVQADTAFQLAPYKEGIGAVQEFVPYVKDK